MHHQAHQLLLQLIKLLLQDYYAYLLYTTDLSDYTNTDDDLPTCRASVPTS